MSILMLHPGQTPLFPPADQIRPNHNGLVALGGVLSPRAILEAYGKGIFPWTGEPPVPWYSPDPRLVLRPQEVRVRRSLRQRMSRGDLQVRMDTNFHNIISLCARTPRPGQQGTWITPNMVATWLQLHHMGHAHCVEVYQDDQLVAGLYGLAMGKAFFGESMVTLVSDGSKVALVTLCRHLAAHGFHFIDCQQDTPHLTSMGATLLTRQDYLVQLAAALDGSTWPKPEPE